MLAHIREADGTEQTLCEHARRTASIAAESLKSCGLNWLGYFVGLHHDEGKAMEPFQTYLRKVTASKASEVGYIKKAPPHAPAGAIWIYERYFNGDKPRKRAAQIAAMAVLGHHGGLTDCLEPDCEYHSPLMKALCRDKDEVCFSEAVASFQREVASAEESDELFQKACAELDVFLSHAPKDIKSFCVSMTARLTLGALTDADRHDTACFERGEDSLAEIPAPQWDRWLASLEARMARFRPGDRLSEIRADISEMCREAGKHTGAGIYRLTVPTGGGKTLSSLLFAIWQAHDELRRCERLLYVAPFNTILDQNAHVIREATGEDELLLEHHADVVLDEDDEEQVNRHRTLTERWTSRIILTSMVQLMNTLFKGSNSNARRLPRLANSIVIFDEIQALPRKCTVLFECATRFLSECLGCTVLLLTATQPTLRAHTTDMKHTVEDLDAKPSLGTELIPDVETLFEELRRVRFADERDKPRTNAQAGAELADMLNEGNSVLMVVNTKKTAQEVYAAVKAADLRKDTVCVYLTTDMCAAHRKREIDRMTEALNRKKREPSAPCVCCVSTALIEAGVDISFPVVVRSAAGLPSILQAAGRCNRNGEKDFGMVYIWRLCEENLGSLKEIRQGQQDSEGILDKAKREGQCIDRPEMISAYFRQQLYNEKGRPSELFYQFEDAYGKRYITRLLGTNKAMREAAEYYKYNPLEHLSFASCWRTAGREFNVIDEDTVAVAVPYGRGADIISKLQSECSFGDEKRMIKELQQYCVSVRRSVFCELNKARAVDFIGKSGVWALKGEFYDGETGLAKQGKPMDFYGY